EPALLGQPVFGTTVEIGDRMPGEELGCDDALGGFLGDGLGAVLAEFRELAAAVLFGPGAAGAVEAVALVEPGQRRRRAPRSHRLQAAPQRPHDGRDTCCLAFRAGDRGLTLVVACVEVAGDIASSA